LNHLVVQLTSKPAALSPRVCEQRPHVSIGSIANGEGIHSAVDLDNPTPPRVFKLGPHLIVTNATCRKDVLGHRVSNTPHAWDIRAGGLS
jgi:hypothetical protein